MANDLRERTVQATGARRAEHPGVNVPAVVSGVCAWLVVGLLVVLWSSSDDGAAAAGFAFVLAPVLLVLGVLGLVLLAVAAGTVLRGRARHDPRRRPTVAFWHAVVMWTVLVGLAAYGMTH
jgi:apolipoprotein N-acyltransferase